MLHLRLWTSTLDQDLFVKCKISIEAMVFTSKRPLRELACVSAACTYTLGSSSSQESLRSCSPSPVGKVELVMICSLCGHAVHGMSPLMSHYSAYLSIFIAIRASSPCSVLLNPRVPSSDYGRWTRFLQISNQRPC